MAWRTMKLDSIKAKLEDYLKEKKLKLFEITYSKKDETLSILLDEKLDLDKLEEVSNDISDYLDKFEDEFEDNYILDVSTIGAERPIRNKKELEKAVGEYIYVKTKEVEYYGTLLDYTDGIINLEVMDKTKKKNVSVDYSKTKQVRYAVKF